MADWFAMGGYAAFVWTCYGVSVGALLVLTLWSWRGYRQAQAQLKKNAS